MSANDERHRVTRLLERLIAVNTSNPPGNEAALAQLLAGELAASGLEVSLTDLGSGRANLAARLRGKSERPAMLWLGHLDTVPVGVEAWQSDPFTATIKGGRLFGRGASDMKSGLAAMSVAAMCLASSGERLEQDLILYFTADEEAGGLGVRRLLQEPWLKNVGRIVVGEPTNLNIGVCEKGALWLEFTTTGRTAHGSSPELGHNAIRSMQLLMNELSRLELGGAAHPLLGRNTLSFGTIAGGVKVNLVPDQCRLTVDIRLTPESDYRELLERVELALRRLSDAEAGFRARFRIINYYPAVQTPTDAPVVQAALAVGSQVLGRTPALVGVTYFTDAALIVSETGLPAVILGPGDPAEAHGPDESLSLSSLHAAVAYYRALGRWAFDCCRLKNRPPSIPI